MTRSELNNAYFEWLCKLVCKKRYSANRTAYRKLLRRLHDIDFNYTIPMDGNRAEDGISLRYRFGYEHSYDAPMIASYLDNRPCSVLEMMIALAIKGIDHIMYDPDIGERPGEWFWNMVRNLGLEYMDNPNFHVDYVDSCIFRFLDREYEPNGAGGLFTVEHTNRDMRFVDIWYQMCYYLDEII